MGLLKGTLTFCRYDLPGKLPANFPGFIDRQLKTFAFHGMATSGEEKALGWTSLENVLDQDFSQGGYTYGDYLGFSLRIDRKVVPPSLLKIKLLETEKKITGEGKRRPSKAQWDEIRERVRLDLLSKAQPVPSFFDLCWSVSQGWMLFGSLSKKVVEEFEDIFKRTFNLPLAPFVPWDPKHLDKKLTEQLSSLKGGVFLLPENADEKAAPSIGREFLTWLWFKSEERGGAVQIPGEGDVELAFARRLVLESGEGEYSESVVCQGLHADLKEGKAAIREGKKIKEARIELSAGAEKWEFTLKADQFQFQSLKLPTGMSLGEEGEEKEGRVLERISLVETALKKMGRLFEGFLQTRLSPQWNSEEIPRLRKWLQK